MIPILFEPTATSFTTNGIGRLSDAISCVAHEARNGEDELEMQFPVGGKHYSDIVHSGIIYAKPSARRGNQAFRIYKISRPINGKVSIYAQHLTYQLNWIPVTQFTAANLTNALQYFVTMSAEDNPFTFSADFTSDADFAVPIPTSVRSYLGGRKGSILDIYGGEWEWDNYNCILHESRGQDSGYVIRYGKNLTDLKQEENILNTYTGVCPYWGSEGTTVTLTEKVLHASTAANYPFQRTLVLDCSEAFDGMPTEAELRTYAQSYMTRNRIGIPSVSLSIDFVNLPDTEEYKNIITGVQNIDLCDTVTVEFPDLGISEKSKVVEVYWDVLNERYEKITVGNSRSTLSGTIEETIKSADAAATTSQVQQKIDRATGVLNAGTRGHIIMNRNESGFANEILALDNDNIAAATRVLRINMNGIGFADSYSGPFYQAWLMDGTLSLGGVNNSYGNLQILDENGAVIGSWDKNGILATGGTFTGDITGSHISGTTIGTTDDEFYVISNESENVEIGFSGFWVEEKVMHTDWIGSTTNDATGDDTAGINGDTGEAGFYDVYILQGGGYSVREKILNVEQTLSDLDDRITALENSANSDDDNAEQGGQNTGGGTGEPYLDDGGVTGTTSG